MLLLAALLRAPGETIYACRYPHCRETKPYASRAAISEQVFNERDRLASVLSPRKPRLQTQDFPSDRKKAAAVASYWLDLTIDQWISRWPATLAFDREAGILRLRVNYTRGIMSALALQLLQAVARQSVYVCAECLQPFLKAGAARVGVSGVTATRFARSMGSTSPPSVRINAEGRRFPKRSGSTRKDAI